MEQENRLQTLERRVAELEAQVQRLSQPGVWRVRGLVVEDSEGRGRILMGAPSAPSPDRQRQDPATAIIFVDEKGVDRLALGCVPDPQKDGEIKPRFSPSVGLILNDPTGFECGGFGVFENGAVGLGVDWPNGREAVSIFSMPAHGLAGIAVHNEEGTDGVSLAWNGKAGKAHVRLPKE